MDVTQERRIQYRVPVTAAMVPVVLALVASVFIDTMIWGAPVFFLMGVHSAWRHGLELTEQEAVVRGPKRARVPWSSVTAVRGGGWRGGLVLQTASWEEIWSPAPCSWWAGAAPEQVAEVERWWIEHRGPAWTPARPVPMPPRTMPPVRYRTSAVAGPVAVLGFLIAAVNAAALWWPLGGFTLLAVEVTEPSVVDAGWMIVAAIAAGAALGGWWAVKAHLVLTEGSPPSAAANAVPGDGARPLLIAVAGALITALAQWLGVAPAIGSLSVVGLGMAAAIAGGTLAAGARRFEQRTGRLLLSTNPLTRGMGLETGPPL